MKKKYYFIVPLLLFIVDMILVLSSIIQPLDDMIYTFVRSFRCDSLTILFKTCSNLGGTMFYIVVIVLLTLFKSRKEIYTGIHLLIIQLINRIIKAIIKRPRPDKLLRLVVEKNYSFPSGHSMSAMIGYGLWIVEIYHSSCKYKKVYCYLLGIMIFLIGLSRIYLGVHYFSDVLGGFLLSLSYLLFIYYNTDLYN